MPIFFANQRTIKKDNTDVANINSNNTSNISSAVIAALNYIPYQQIMVQSGNLCPDCVLPSGFTYDAQCTNGEPPTWIPNPYYSPPATPTPTPTPTPSPTPTATPSPSSSSTPTPSIP